ncbi:hypothetical protein BN424_968 [Carnobacterium maltaromaticum LMA28]|uniref:Uncharacterized protein n=1 Tax=Carnobacterium maltaromaticum LMA28 TaxID=1234679 RepID=K8E304_CARML|nr:hypothetical protein BN424_968 [Carnobacterium maltaromaticum LMA28]
MRLNEQIEIERKNKGLSKKKLVQIIEESIGLTFKWKQLNVGNQELLVLIPKFWHF